MRRRLLLVGLPGSALFVLCAALTRGGVLDRRGYGDAGLYAHYAYEMASGKWPYRDFFDEYPVLAQPLFYVVRLLPGRYLITLHWTMAAFGVATLLTMVAALRAPLWRVAVAAGIAALSPLLLGPVLLNMYDLFPTFLTLAAVFFLLRERWRTAYVLLALAVAAKVYPLVLLPLALVETYRLAGRTGLRSAVRWFVGVLVLVHLPFVALGPGGVRFSYWVQIKRGLEVESLAGSVLLVLDRLGVHHVVLGDVAPGSRDVLGGLGTALATLSSLVVLVAVLGLAWLHYRRPRRDLAAAGAAITAFVAFGKVLSPQYLVWLIPFAAGPWLVEAALLTAALVLTHLEWDRFIGVHGDKVHWGHVLSWWIFARDLVLVALFAALATRVRAGARSRSLP